MILECALKVEDRNQKERTKQSFCVVLFALLLLLGKIKANALTL